MDRRSILVVWRAPRSQKRKFAMKSALPANRSAGRWSSLICRPRPQSPMSGSPWLACWRRARTDACLPAPTSFADADGVRRRLSTDMADDDGHAVRLASCREIKISHRDDPPSSSTIYMPTKRGRRRCDFARARRSPRRAACPAPGVMRLAFQA